MSHVVYKYVLGADDDVYTTIAGPIIHVATDPKGWPCVWILGDKASTATRRLTVVGTGQDLPAGDWLHRGSWVTDPFVWHCFEARAGSDKETPQ